MACLYLPGSTIDEVQFSFDKSHPMGNRTLVGFFQCFPEIPVGRWKQPRNPGIGIVPKIAPLKQGIFLAQLPPIGGNERLGETVFLEIEKQRIHGHEDLAMGIIHNLIAKAKGHAGLAKYPTS